MSSSTGLVAIKHLSTSENSSGNQLFSCLNNTILILFNSLSIHSGDIEITSAFIVSFLSTNSFDIILMESTASSYSSLYFS